MLIWSSIKADFQINNSGYFIGLVLAAPIEYPPEEFLQRCSNIPIEGKKIYFPIVFRSGFVQWFKSASFFL